MKTFILTLVFLAGTAIYAQEKEVVRTVKTVKISTYHDNGVLAQSGHQFKGKNHGIWMSYNSQGIKLSKGVYDKGDKTDRWFFWNEGILIEVDYKDNIVQSATKWDKAESLASKDD